MEKDIDYLDEDLGDDYIDIIEDMEINILCKKNPKKGKDYAKKCYEKRHIRNEKRKKDEFDAAYKKALQEYIPPDGRRVRVKDMRPGWVYTFTDMSLEDYFYFVMKNSYYPEIQKMDALIENAGLLTEPVPINDEGKAIVKLYACKKSEQMKLVPNSPKAKGLTFEPTGKMIWYAENSWRTLRRMEPDDEVVEARPYPVGIYREGWALEMLPDPETWVQVSADTPHSWSDDYVNAWDESDLKTLVVLGVISFVLFFGGPSLWSVIVTMWVFAAIWFYGKHKKIRDQILEERRERGIRGSGLDDQFWWR